MSLEKYAFFFPKKGIDSHNIHSLSNTSCMKDSVVG